jgi:hypothetical protein
LARVKGRVGEIKTGGKMRISKAPSWPAIIISGLAGGLVNWYYQTHIIGVMVFLVLSSLFIILRNKKTSVPTN